MTAPITRQRSPARRAKRWPPWVILSNISIGITAPATKPGLWRRDCWKPKAIMSPFLTRISFHRSTFFTMWWITSAIRKSAWCRSDRDHLNRNASLLTKSQAIFLDGHFVIEHTARNRSGRFMHFNGTAGVWRRSTIDDAGGWQHDTLTEDLDLSYRAQLKGWQFVYLPQYAAPAELPPEIIGFKQQAHRWTKGSCQTAIKLLPRILKSKHLPLSIKTEAFFHLTCTVVYPLMVVLTLLMYPSFFSIYGPFKSQTWAQWLFSGSLFVLATCSASTFFLFAQRELFGRQAAWKSLLYLPFLMGLGVGVSLNNAKAVIEAIYGAIKTQAQRICPHTQVWCHRSSQEILAADQCADVEAPDAADHRSVVRHLHVHLPGNQRMVLPRCGQCAVPGCVCSGIFLRRIQFHVCPVPDEPGNGRS